MSKLKINDWVKIPEDKSGSSLAQVKELYPESPMKAKLYWPSEDSTGICTEMQYYVKCQPNTDYNNIMYDSPLSIPESSGE